MDFDAPDFFAVDFAPPADFEPLADLEPPVPFVPLPEAPAPEPADFVVDEPPLALDEDDEEDDVPPHFALERDERPPEPPSGFTFFAASVTASTALETVFLSLSGTLMTILLLMNMPRGRAAERAGSGPRACVY